MNDRYTRRAFLRTLTVLGASALLPDAQAAAFVPVGKVGHFPVGTMKSVTLPGGRTVFVHRLSPKATAAAFHVLSGACTHKGCPVAWVAAHHQFQCPCHQGKFDISGKVVSGPPPAPLPTLSVRIANGVLMVSV